MDTETGCGLPSTGEKARPLIGGACLLKFYWWNFGCFCKGTSMAAPPYQEALDRAGYQHKLEYIEADANACERRRRKRKRTLFIH